MVTRWRSWSGIVRATPVQLLRPTSAGEVADVVRRARGRGQVVRPVGSGHSFTPIAATDDVMVSLADVPPTVQVDPDGAHVTAAAGMTIRQLNRALATHDLALANAGDIDRQALAGALATGTHGTGAAFGPMHTAVVGVELVDGRGELRWVDDADLPAARLALGALGIVTRVRLAVVPAYRLATTVAKVSLDDVLADFDAHVADHRHAEFYWLPHTRTCQLKLGDASDEPALPAGLATRANDVVLENAAVWVAGQVARTFPTASPAVSRALAAGIADVEARRPSHDAFASTRWVRFQEAEHALPRAALPVVLEGLDRLITDRRLPVALPVEVRAVAGDESAWLSPAWGRDSAYVAIHTFRGMPYTEYVRAAEELFLAHGSRPHWGKVHTLDAAALRPRYPRWDDFAAARGRFDPDGVFASPYLDRVLGHARPSAGAG